MVCLSLQPAFEDLYGFMIIFWALLVIQFSIRLVYLCVAAFFLQSKKDYLQLLLILSFLFYAFINLC